MKTTLLLTLSLVCLATSTERAQSRQTPDPSGHEPRYSSDGQLMKPDDYREWIYLSSGLGMTYGPAASPNPSDPRFDNVFVTPEAYKSFMTSGTWPEKTMFVLEVRSAAAKGSINNGGHYQDQVTGVEVEVKDSSRFPKKWAFFGFNGSAQTSKPFAESAGCLACHSANGAVDNTFVQFYPTLIPVAKAKGTFKTTP
jgi:hypothetical protein